MRGGGSGVRDELCYINDKTLPPGKFRIYDPLDKDDRIVAFALDPAARPMLDTIWPSDSLNDKLVEYTVGMMQQRWLYLPKYLDLSARPRQRELHVGYDAAHALVWQLLKLRQTPTKNYRSFYMEGDTDRARNKKDLWAAFIYAAKQMRAHIIRQHRIDNAPPALGGLITHIGSKRRQYGRAPGSRL
jgi:hypothetical protein